MSEQKEWDESVKVYTAIMSAPELMRQNELLQSRIDKLTTALKEIAWMDVDTGEFNAHNLADIAQRALSDLG